MQLFLATMLALAVTIASSHTGTTSTGTTTTASSDASALHCTADNPTVWVNTSSHVYHMKGSPYYGNTKHGKYMCKRSAIAAHNHEAKDEKGSMMKGAPAPEATK